MFHSAFQTKLREVIRLLKKHRVKRAYVFGSVARENFHDRSDVDLLISFDENMDALEYGDHYFALYESLQKLLNRNVDLVTESSLKNPYLIESIKETRIPLYE